MCHVSQHFQRRASGSASEQGWLGGCSLLCSVAGGRCGTEPLAEEKGVYSLWKDVGTAEQHSGRSPASVFLKVLCFLMDSRKAPRPWQTLNLLARTSLQGYSRHQQDCLRAFLSSPLKKVKCSGWYLDIIVGVCLEVWNHFDLTLERSGQQNTYILWSAEDPTAAVCQL